MNRLFYGWYVRGGSIVLWSEVCTYSRLFLLRPTIQKSIPRAYVAWRNRFLGSLNAYKYGLFSIEEPSIVIIVIARICKPFKEPRNRFPALRAGTRQSYLTYRPARLYGLAESIPWIFKHLQIRALFASHFFRKASYLGWSGTLLSLFLVLFRVVGCRLLALRQTQLIMVTKLRVMKYISFGCRFHNTRCFYRKDDIYSRL
jgi:hypothetical protein